MKGAAGAGCTAGQVDFLWDGQWWTSLPSNTCKAIELICPSQQPPKEVACPGTWYIRITYNT